jgi:ribosomal protein S27AE
MQKMVICPNCGTGLTVGEQIGGKVMLGLIGLAAGGRVDPLVAAAASLFGILLGHIYIDQALRNCPQCGTLIKIAGGLI